MISFLSLITRKTEINFYSRILSNKTRKKKSYKRRISLSLSFYIIFLERRRWTHKQHPFSKKLSRSPSFAMTFQKFDACGIAAPVLNQIRAFVLPSSSTQSNDCGSDESHPLKYRTTPITGWTNHAYWKLTKCIAFDWLYLLKNQIDRFT